MMVSMVPPDELSFADGSAAPPTVDPLLERAFRCATVGLAIVTFDGDILVANDALTAHCGGDAEALIATCLSAADSWRPSDGDAAGVALPSSAVVDHRLDLAGHDRWLRVHLTPIDDATSAPTRLLVHVEEVTSEIREARRLHDLALRDELTGLPNRRALFERMAHCLAAGDPRVERMLFYIDLDGFKEINDRLGHTAGDGLLVAIAARLQTHFAGGWVARYGGDEFVGCIAAPDLPSHPQAFVRRLKRLIAAPVRIDQTEITVTACVGRTVLRPDDREPMQPITRADRAMYRSKLARLRSG